MTNREILNTIKAIRESFIGAETVYTQGGCHGFYRIMKSIYSDAKLFINATMDHVAVEIYGDLYDINGEIPVADHASGLFREANGADEEIAESWTWDLHCKGWECPGCDEIFSYTEMREYRKRKIKPRWLIKKEEQPHD